MATTTRPRLVPAVTCVASSPVGRAPGSGARLARPDRPAPPAKDAVTALDPTARVAASPAPGKRSKAAAYLALTKPRIIELLLVTTVPVMFLAHKGVPSLW